jgi:hypothetical protein
MQCDMRGMPLCTIYGQALINKVLTDSLHNSVNCTSFQFRNEESFKHKAISSFIRRFGS